ncbi:carboxypeptidase-like regulatory domain-containing protein [Aquimarina litoralis]|uniref:carboxypeptidase-like regulatory domain-containing protein n=1 Tax=Aquimarina litoralis TaxID=584605 RepID=UPI001C5893E0|nr:carboxypeptidase-like regulatory domain-containing protein [Aquimarina litoralis]MBW1296370.1 hypothetical protein [Aquimarina litoralis]
MKIKIGILNLVVLIYLIGCAKKTYSVCGLELGENTITIDSKIIELKRIAIADTTPASISGKIYAKSFDGSDTLTENFAYTNIFVRDLKTDSLIGTTSNLKGEYQFTIPAAEYDLEVQFIGYNNLKVHNIKITTGEIINFSAIIGQGNGVTEYLWNSNGSYKNKTE